MKKPILFYLLIFCFGYLLCSSAMAGNEKIYPGTGCFPKYGDTKYVRNIYTGVIKNTSPGIEEFFCPLIRDETGDLYNDSISITYIDNSNMNIRCCISAAALDGVHYNSEQCKESSTKTSVANVMTFNSVYYTYDRNLVLQCSLPYNTSIIYYHNKE